MSGGTLSVSWGRYGGFYVTHLRGTRLARGRYLRLCLGWAALTYIPIEIDDLMQAYADSKVSA